MGETNLNFILALGLAIGAFGFTIRLIHARLRLDRYKKNTRYKLYVRATRTHRIVISAIVAVALAINLVFQFQNTSKLVDDSTLIFDFVYTAATLAISIVVAIFVSKKMNPKEK